MGLKCGIVGLPNVGKSTLFNALTSAKAEAANYPFCTIDPNVGIVPVPDERLNQLAELVRPEKITPAVLEVVDIAGLVKGASKGEGLGNQFLSHIREVDAILHIVRCFENENIVHVSGNINPVRDKEIIDTELQLKDLESLEKKIKSRYGGTAKGQDKEAIEGLEVLRRIKKHLEAGKNIRQLLLNDSEKKHTGDIFLLTDKPVLYVCNVDEKTMQDAQFTMQNEYVKQLADAIPSTRDENSELLVICAEIEAEIAQMENENDRKEFMEALGLKEPGLHRLIHSAYHLLNYITFFTAGPKEVRAWTIVKGTKAMQAAGTIHSDFEKGFIRAEVIKLEDYLKYKTETAVKEAGKMRVEGKDYEMQDGDVIYFRFNV